LNPFNLRGDYQPTDSASEWQIAVGECHAAEREKRCSIFPIGVDDADMEVLAEVSSCTEAVQMGAAKFKEFFLWLSASTKAASRSTPGDMVQLPSPNGWVSVSS
jgi:uncharacterized protein YegL